MEPEQKSNGALIGSIIIIVILIIGGIYLWINMEKPTSSPVTEEQNQDSTAELETEINSMDLDNLDDGI